MPMPSTLEPPTPQCFLFYHHSNSNVAFKDPFSMDISKLKVGYVEGDVPESVLSGE